MKVLYVKIVSLFISFSVFSLHAETPVSKSAVHETFKYINNEESGIPNTKKTDANIVGHTVSDNGEHLGYITIAIEGSTIGTSTDATGHYYIKNLPEGTYKITATAIGYKKKVKEIILQPGKTIEVNFSLSEDAIELNNVVVTANRNETSRKEASNIVNVISNKLFETTNSVCLSQSLNFQPGLRVETNCQNCGFQQVKINGLDGPYSQILIDSRPIFSALAGVYGIEQIPTNMIERVEVVRGGGSALFGSNAIAGTINIITKEALNNFVTISHNTSLIMGSKADLNTSVNAALVSDDNKAGISLFGSTRQRDHWDANGDGFSEIGLIQAQNVGFRSYYKLSTQSKISLEYHNLSEFRRGGNNFEVPAHFSDITEQTNHNINSGGIKYDYISKDTKHRLNIYLASQNVDRDSYYGAKQDPDAYGTTSDFSFVSGLQYNRNFDLLFGLPATLTLGGEYNINTLKDMQPSYNRTIDQKVDTKSIFAQNEWKREDFSVLIGLRLDDNNLLENPIISPRLNLRYELEHWINLRASYASGFRAPQAFDEDLHITAVGGDVQIILLDPELKPERSNSFSVSTDIYKNLGNVQTNLLIEAFHTEIRDIFYLRENGLDANGNTLLQRTNGIGAGISGINLEGKIVPGRKINLQTGFTFQKSLYTQAQVWSENENIEARREMFRAPNNYGYLTLSYQRSKALVFSFSGTYTGTMLVQHYGAEIEEDEEVETPQFFDLAIKSSYEFKLGSSTKLQINAGVQNIFNSFQKDFDTGITRDAGYVYGPSSPRTFYAGLKFQL